MEGDNNNNNNNNNNGAESSSISILLYVLAYLPLQELLVMTSVSKSLRDAVNEDVLVWLSIVVENPLNLRLTDQTLLKITSKANAKLHTLALINCFKITDQCLLNLVIANPYLTKLYVPGCTSLTPQGVVMAVKTLTAKPSCTLTILNINGIYNIKKEDLEILKSLIPQTTKTNPKLLYHKYRRSIITSSSFRNLDEEEARPIDVELCRKCNRVKLVFDCPAPNHGTKCKGCLECFPRCEVCGNCMDKEDEQGDTICNDIVCLHCWLRLPKCNHCNKPFCPRHAHKHNHLGSQGFQCEVCQAKQLHCA